MELKEGMFVRTNITDNCNNVYIRKITEIENNRIWIDEDLCDGWGDESCCIRKEDIEIADFNPVKVVKVGDYINGEYVDLFSLDYFKNHPENIKSIVTKELLNCVNYEVNS